MRSPSEAQIKFADEISETLDIDFPTCSQDFNAYTYFHFIADHINEYQEIIASDPSFDDVLEWCPPIDEWGN